LAVDGAQNLPIVDRIYERAFLFVMVGPRDDRVDQVALVLHQPQCAFEVRLPGILLQGFFQNVHFLVEIGLSFHLPVDGSNERRKLLPLLFFNVILERLKKRVIGILSEVTLAGSQRLVEVAIPQIFLRLDICGVHRIMFGTDFVVKTLVGATTLWS